MGDKDFNTESKILDAAEDVFIQKGMDGARMQEIADKAGINKALLHYYYRTKEKLFLSVFKLALSKFIPKVEKIVYSEISIFDKIKIFVEEYGGLLYKNQFIPLFILSEIRRNPDALANVVKSQGISPKLFANMVQKEINEGRIRNIDPKQLIMNMLSLIIFPIAARPMLQRIIYSNDKKAFDAMLKQRLKEIPDFIINAIKV